MRSYKSVLLGSLLALAITPAMATQPTPVETGLFGPTPSVPSIYTDNLTRLQVPNLSIPERAAFSTLESIQQLGEAYIQANGCGNYNASLDVYADRTGAGDSTIVSSGNTLKLLVKRTGSDSFRGDKYQVSGSTGGIRTTNFVGFIGNYTFNKTGSIMAGASTVGIPNPTAPTSVDVFKGKVIKDFFAYNQNYQGTLRTFILDWGLQVIEKNEYPVAKYFQRSWSLRDNGIEGVTKFQKTRIAGGVACRIVTETRGYNNNENFNEQGTLRIFPVPASVNVR